MEEFIIGWIVGIVIVAIIWGITTNKIIRGKGYAKNWFWWGFFFGLFATLVAIGKTDLNLLNAINEANKKGDVQEKNISKMNTPAFSLADRSNEDVLENVFKESRNLFEIEQKKIDEEVDAFIRSMRKGEIYI